MCVCMYMNIIISYIYMKSHNFSIGKSTELCRNHQLPWAISHNICEITSCNDRPATTGRVELVVQEASTGTWAMNMSPFLGETNEVKQTST